MPNFTDISPGDKAELAIEITEKLIADFATYSGDFNPLHTNRKYAGKTKFKRPVAHGLSYASLFSRLVGMKLPGPGALWLSQDFSFKKPACIGDKLILLAEVTEKNTSTRTLRLKCIAKNQHGETILTGAGEVMALENEEIKTEEKPSQRISLVVGGSRGIGEAIVKRLDADGHKVFFTYFNSDTDATALTEKLTNVLAIKADASSPKEAKFVIEKIHEFCGEVPDTVIMCASPPLLESAAADGDFSVFQTQLSVNLEYCHSVFSVCLPNMSSHNFGRLVGIGTTYSLATPPSGFAPYVVAKSALAAYIRSVAVDYGYRGIRANIVAPSMTETALLARVSDRDRKVAALRNPARRLAVPEDIANAVAFLVSPESGYINGETLVVSGGEVML